MQYDIETIISEELFDFDSNGIIDGLESIFCLGLTIFTII